MIRMISPYQFNPTANKTQSSRMAFGVNPKVCPEELESLASRMVRVGTKMVDGKKTPLFQGIKSHQEAEQLAELIHREGNLPLLTVISIEGEKVHLHSIHKVEQRRVLRVVETDLNKIPESIQENLKQAGGSLRIHPTAAPLWVA